MRRLISLFAALLIFASVFNSCKPDPIEEFGSIYGIVTDKATGEPVKNANVQLRPSGETTLTGTDGRYEFVDLKNGEYSITVSKTEYTDLVDDYVIKVEGAKAMRRDVQIEKIPALLKILDSNGNEIEELDFGSMLDDNIRMFSIFNNSTMSLQYQIYKTASWIVGFSSAEGSMNPGETRPIVITIDRTKLSLGDNATTITIVTNNGGKQLAIKANKAGDVSTKDAINVTTSSATLRGVINKQLAYSEKGFYYGTDSNASNKKVVSGTNSGEFSCILTDLQEGTTYCFKAYMIVDGESVDGELRYFTTNVGNGGEPDEPENPEASLPTVVTGSVGDITTDSALCGGEVTSDGGAAVTARGVCWSTAQNPSINSKKTVDGSGMGSYSSQITGLSSNTTYHYRAYATNSKGTAYGEVKSFTTEEITMTGEINGYEYVDLGLPSGLKWATCNVGATSPEMSGGFYAWGELETKDYYGEDNSSTYEVVMEDISGDPQYDVARAEWGSTWRMPKVNEMNELMSYCTYEEMDINGREVYKLTSKINGCSIILPRAGYKISTYHHYYNATVCYWSSTPYQSSLNNRAYGKDGYGCGSCSTPERYMGFTIRPVSN
ncbi:MAG: carboxypeptidase regulatory-like domain-containing protein [Bacteroidales bacterium]|nr:carboxypeptidase regulatory-like domain-containing protein [Bacteroidales bacterium]